MLGYAPSLGQVCFEQLTAKYFMRDDLSEKLAKGHDSFFRDNVTMVLVENEEIFAPMYADWGRPSVSPACLAAAEIYKRQNRLTDRELEEAIQTSPVAQLALGVRGLYGDGCAPWSRTTITEFRNRAKAYEEKTGINMYKVVFDLLQEKYRKRMHLRLDNVLMDSTLIQGNIKVMNRAELLFSGIRLFSRDLYAYYSDDQIKEFGLDVDLVRKYWVNTTFRNQLAYYGTMTYAETCKLHMDVFAKILSAEENPFLNTNFAAFESYGVMKKVFSQQCVIGETEDGQVTIRMATKDDKQMTSDILQSVIDLDCAYRKKGEQICRGYVVNTAETVGIEGRLITSIEVHPANVSDLSMLEHYLNALPDVDPSLPRNKYGRLIADGAYYSDEKAKLALSKGYILCCTDLMGNKPDPFLAGFQWNGEFFTHCPLGKEVMSWSPANKAGTLTIKMNPADCAGCPHRAQCRVEGKRVARIKLSFTMVNRAKILQNFTEAEGEAIRRLRSGTEGVESLIKVRFNRKRMVFRGLPKIRQDFYCIGCAANFARCYAYAHGFVFNTDNPLLT